VKLIERKLSVISEHRLSTKAVVSRQPAPGLWKIVLCTCLGPERKRSHSDNTSGAETMT
jgi:hypothetical protein